MVLRDNDIVYSYKTEIGHFVTFSNRPNFQIKTVKQTHGSIVVDKENANSDREADGIFFSDLLEPYPAIVTADCIPVLVIGETRHAIIHAGWRGVKNGVVINALKEIDRPKCVVIGPHIKECCFEVTSEFKDYFLGPKNFTNRSSKIFFSLEQELILQIKVYSPQIDIINLAPCTCCNNEFHSYRRDRTQKRNWNLLLPSFNIF